jgi:3-oxoacyl-[acyl-carrier protein] reductase
VLVNNASALAVGDDRVSWEACCRVDLLRAVRASQRAIPWLRESPGGAIVHAASTAALAGSGPLAYSALKAALPSHAKNLALALAPAGVRVNCGAPGPVEFPGGIWDHARREQLERRAAMRASIPAARFGRPEEVAAAIVFLASDAARWITGATLCVDGGQHRGIF